MPNCPVCKKDKPALSFGGTCSWACKGSMAKPTPVVTPPPAPLTLRRFFEQQGAGHVLAARRENNSKRLFYYRVAGDVPGHVRPSVYLQDYLKRFKIQVKGKVIVNYPVDAWINKNSELEQKLEVQDRSVLDAEVDPVLVDGQLDHWKQFSLDKLGPKPGLTGLGEEIVPVSVSKARRIYMLATFCILKKFGLIDTHRTGGHNIGAILVSGQGQVLSWGVNTGEFRHAEVNTIINYFRLNPTAKRLPAKSVLFSSLKPCLMCSSLVKEAWHADGEPRVWYGMMDEGGSGSTPLLGDWSKEFKPADIELDVWELLSPTGTLDSAIKTAGTKPVNVTKDGRKVDLYAELTATLGTKPSRTSAADWVDESADVLKLIDAALLKFSGKAGKVREDGPMKQVLAHLKPFVT